MQWAISLEKVVIHFFYGGMPPEKAEKSLRLFAEKVPPGGAGHGHAHQPRVARGRHALSHPSGAGRTCPAPMSPAGG